MRPRTASAVLLLVGVSLAGIAARPATALSVEVALPGLVGAYDRRGDERSDSFDLGVQFSAIESIQLRFEVGDGARGGACVLSIPGYCTVGSVLEATLSGAGEQISGSVWGLGRNSPNWLGIPRPWLQSARVASGGDFEVLPIDPNWPLTIDPGVAAPWPHFLLRGWGDVTLRLGGLDQPFSGFHRAEILGATLIVTGTPVPAPSTAVSIMLGLLMLKSCARPRDARG